MNSDISLYINAYIKSLNGDHIKLNLNNQPTDNKKAL